MSPLKSTPAAINSNKNNYLNITSLKNFPYQQKKILSIASGTFAIALIAGFGIATYTSWDKITHLFGIKTPAEETTISLILTKTKPVLRSAGAVASFVGKYGWGLTKSYYSNLWSLTKSCYYFGSNISESFHSSASNITELFNSSASNITGSLSSNAWNLTKSVYNLVESSYTYCKENHPKTLYSRTTKWSMIATTLILAKAPFNHPLLCKIQFFLNQRTPDPFPGFGKTVQFFL